MVTPDGYAALRRELEHRLDPAHTAIAPYVLRTSLAPFPLLSEATGAQVLLKCEHLQHTGSFKVRGALAKLSSLDAADRERGVVAASTGNHGLGVAYALSKLGGQGLVCVPPGASPVKLAAIERFGVEVREMGPDAGQTEIQARRYADDYGLTYISPYNDIDVIAGQASIGLEVLVQALELGVELDAVVVSVGGGGLASGIAAAIKRANPAIAVIGASPEVDAAMAVSVATGHIVEVSARPTLSDGTAGGLEPGAITFPLCQGLIDEWVLVTETEIARALRQTVDSQHQLVEGAAAVAVAAASKHIQPGQTVAVISCGANISAAALQRALELSA
jgi:threonine dehydratase